MIKHIDDEYYDAIYNIIENGEIKGIVSQDHFGTVIVGFGIGDDEFVLSGSKTQIYFISINDYELDISQDNKKSIFDLFHEKHTLSKNDTINEKRNNALKTFI